MKRQTTYGIVALAAMALLLIGGVSAFGGMGLGFGVNKQNLSEAEKTQMQEFRDNVQTAIENEDYEAWKTLMETQLTQENFQILVDRSSQMQEVQDIREQMREAKDNNDTETFEELRTQLQELMPEGKAFGNEFSRGFDHGMMPGKDFSPEESD